MKFDFNSYEIFVTGVLNPNRHTKYDTKARKAEKKFLFDIKNFKDGPVVYFKLKLEEILKNPHLIEKTLNELDYRELGFVEGEKISVAIDTEEIDDEGRIEVRIRSEEKSPFPSLDSKKTKFFDKKMSEIKSGIKKDIKKRTLSFKSEEQVNAYISQQYQFAHFYYQAIKRLRKSSEKLGKSFNKFSSKKRPIETNDHIFLMILSDIRNLIKFVEDSYPFYLKTKMIPLDDKVPESPTFKKQNVAEKPSKWKTIFNIDNFELKPNFAGIGINLNELIKKLTKRST